ncbi:MAG: hypothetical protein M3Y87_14835 [Myxococcota bacterium]|nr:hypothetical protein [Myxococcota bacterium]
MASRRITPTGWIRVATLALIAIICLASAVGWSDPDLWIPFVCIIAVMGVGTRGGMLDALPFVLIEAAVVVMLGVATFSGSRDFIWAASVAVSLLAVGKIALLEMTKELHEESPSATKRTAATPDPTPGDDDPPPPPAPPSAH